MGSASDDNMPLLCLYGKLGAFIQLQYIQMTEDPFMAYSVEKLLITFGT
jgi:hypothetical protein